MAFINREEVVITTGASFLNIVMDVTTNASSNYSIFATEHPIDQGLPITDLISRNSTTLTLNGIFTDYTSRAHPEGHDLGRSEDVLEELNNIMNKGEVFEVVSNNRVYTNMLLKSINLQDTRHNYNSIEVSLDFQEVRIAKTRFVLLNRPLDRIELPASQNKIAGGIKPSTAPATPANTETINNEAGQIAAN